MPDMLEFWMPFIRSKAHGVEVLDFPKGDITLEDGNVLHNYQQVVQRHGKEFDHGFAYRGPDKMHVVATSCSTPVGLILHVSISFPNRDPTKKEIELIRKAFYPAHINCSVELSKADRTQPYNITHIWQVPPDAKIA